MKYLIYFLLFSTVVFSQNYQYAIEEAPSIKLLNAPTDLVASEITESSVVLSWTSPTNNASIKEYGIYNKNILAATSVGTETSYKITGLVPETTYTFTVRSIDKIGNISTNSNTQTFITSTIVSSPMLDPPTGLIASEITETSVVLSWTAPANDSLIKEYGIYNKNILVATSSGTGTSYKITGLAPETAYTFSVRALDKEGNLSNNSNAQAVITNKLVDEPILAAPINLIASDITESTVVLSWTAPTNGSSIKEYGIYSKNILLATSSGTEISYKITGLVPETTYSFTVRSVDKGGIMSIDSNVATFTTTKIAAPTDLLASEITETTVILTWRAPTGNTSVTDYGIYSESNLLAKSVGIGTSFKVTGLTPETLYNLTVRAIDKVGNMSVDSNAATFTTNTTVAIAGVNNQLEEIEYFKAHLLPIAQKGTIQKALDTYGAVRLEKGDYSGVDIVMKSNQMLYGHPSLTKISNITIAAGSSNVHLEDLLPADNFITFQPGGVISDCTFKSIKWATIQGTNMMLKNSTFINCETPIRFDCSQSGYFRNIKIIKSQSGTVPDLLVMKGNSNTPSYGNVHLHTNFRSPHGNTTTLDNLQSATFVGIDAESWNFKGEGSKALLDAQKIGSIKITDFGGGNGATPSSFRTPSYDIDAVNAFFLSKTINGTDGIVSSTTNLFVINGAGMQNKKSGMPRGFDLLGNVDFSNAIFYDQVEQKGIITNSSIVKNLSTAIRGPKFTPWIRPNWETLPDPLGTNWKTDRIGKPDQASYLQNLINTKGIVELPEGTFYIASTLLIPTDSRHGLIGKGTGKTVLVGLTDDFPLISLAGSNDGSINLAHLTIQGGSVGVYASTDYGYLNIAYQNMKFVVFRDQNYGIHVKKTGGFDNNFLENLGFVNCKIGFFQEPTAGNSGEDNSAYVDKTMFYKNQFINCETAVSMLATRADNLNAWVDCKFDQGKVALDLAGQNNPILANCDFSNYTGTNVIRTNAISMYSCNVFDNRVQNSTILSSYTNIEGCRFLDRTKMFSPMLYTSLNNHIVNSIISGDVLARVPLNQGFGKESAIYCNSILDSNQTISKLLVNLKEGVETVILDAVPDPYPQLLVTQ